MTKKNLILLCGGGGSEHEISLVSCGFIYDQIKDWDQFNVHWVEICKDGARRDRDGKLCELRKAGELVYTDSGEVIPLHYAIAYMHGPPAETGDIQSVFEMMGLPYLGASPEASILCFNKVSTKLWFDALGIPNTPFCYLTGTGEEELKKANDFFNKNPDVFVKAASQGSSVGCYHCDDSAKLHETIKKAFEYSEYVILEKTIKGRELELSVYEKDGEVHATAPGEIICPNEFYTYEEKYNDSSETTTTPKAKNIPEDVVAAMRKYALAAFKGLKIKDLSRIDFFLDDNGSIYLNEINTLPGMTPISLFPLMMEANGHSFKEWIRETVEKNAR